MIAKEQYFSEPISFIFAGEDGNGLSLGGKRG